MKNIAFLIFLLLTLFSCKKTKVEIMGVATDSTAFIEHEINEEFDDYNEFVLCYVIDAAQGYNYDSLKQVAQDVSMLLHWPLDSLNRYYNADKKLIIVPENSDDEMWAGEYYLRRHGDNFISVEMSNAYLPVAIKQNKKAKDLFFQDTTSMFVCAGIFENETTAESVLSKVRTQFPQAQIIPTEIYMGCMH